MKIIPKKNVKFGGECLAQVIDGVRIPIDDRNLEKLIANGFEMASLTGPIDRNPLVGFDVLVEQVDTIDIGIRKMKGLVLQKIIMKSMASAFGEMEVEVREPKMAFDLSLYSTEHKFPVLALLEKHNCTVTREREGKDSLTIEGNLMVTAELELQKQLTVLTRGNCYLETEYIGF